MKIPVASCVIADDYGRILLLHRTDLVRTYWELPGGTVEEDESVNQALTRHLSDYMGIEVQLEKVLGSVESEADTADYVHVWIQGVIRAADPELNNTESYDDLEYFEIEDFMALALSDDASLFLDKIMSGEISLEAI